MSTTIRVPSIAVTLGFLLAISWALPSPSRAAWVNSTATQFQVGGKLTEIVPTLVSTAPGIATSPTYPALVDPTCVSTGGGQGGTSLALVRGSKLAGVDRSLYPIVLVVSCLDNGAGATIRSRLNFINPVTFNIIGTQITVQAGTVVKQLTTTVNGVAFAPSTGWAHLVHRPDKGDLLGCGSDGTLYSIDYSQTNSVTDGAATALPQVASSCAGLAWDAETKMIYQGLTVGGGTKISQVVSFADGTATKIYNFTNLPCGANGLAISGGVLLMSCNGSLTMQRLDKKTGGSLGAYPTVTATGLTSLTNDPGLGDLACDPVTFQRDPLGRDLYRDTMWSRRGAVGNGVAALEFPPFTCGLPSNSVVVLNGVSFSPLAPGLSTGTLASPGQSPLAVCFDGNGIVVDTDGDGLPDCWETNKGGSVGPGGIDFDGDGTMDITLCAQVDTNGDDSADNPPNTPIGTPWCADPNHKDLFVEVGWMANHRPDPKALSQTTSVASVGVQSVREAFGAAPVINPDGKIGINIYIQVDKQAVTFLNFTRTAVKNEVTNVALTPCTAPASAAPDPNDAADYDAIKNGIPAVGQAGNFGMFDAANPPSPKAMNAMRLAFRYVLFAHNLVGNPSGGSSSSGCSEVGGDDAVVSLGSFTSTTVNGINHARGNTDQQAGTFMHEFGHLLGFEHGGEDTINNKPNYRSVMNYSRQFSGSPILGRRLDYSRSEVDLNEANLNECAGIGTLGSDLTLGPILPFFPAADQIAFGPGAWSVVTPTSATVSGPCAVGLLPINWDRSTQGKSSSFQTQTIGDINSDGANTTLSGSNDWANVLYRFSAAIDFAGGRSETLTSSLSGSEMTKENEIDFFLKKDVDGNGIGDGRDCGGTITLVNNVPTTSFPCTHRIDIKPSFSFPKAIHLGTEATVSIAIFSETNGASVWDATTQVVTLTNGCTASAAPCLTFSIENVIEPVKTNKNGQGTCSAQTLADPVTGQNDSIKDLKCQFPTSGLPTGTHFGVVSGYFVDPLDNNAVKAFSARQEVTILP
jgi:hypothetical protein